MAAGADILGLCLYPIMAYPGWDNERHCDVGLFGTPAGGGERAVYPPLADELRRQQARFPAYRRQPAPRVTAPRVRVA